MPSTRPLPVIPPLRGRGASWNPANRFERLHLDREAWTDPDDPPPETVLLDDATRSILARNDSPDVGFDVGMNPYRGCGHGCTYCYARPTHEYLGFSAGLDFETKILVKRQAPHLLRKALSSPRWKPEAIMLSGNTDPYQPVERRLRITRRCLEVLAEFRNPVAITTKSYLVTRDVDLLGELAEHDAVAVTLSVTTLRNELQRVMEPRASTPARRLGAIKVLADNGIPVGVNVAPVVPGLTDHELPAILEAAADAGASWAGYILLRLPHGVKELFERWLDQRFPDRKDKVLNRVREMRGGRLYDARFSVRGHGEGPWGEQLGALFRVTRERFGLNRPAKLSTDAFRRPEQVAVKGRKQTQLDLFA
jgi:DNA repair photolyase